ncbi:MAG: 6-carboxytetrahydropterin synthase QueD [Desulfovibrionaceae bacterium]|nr:6-carboxytetrahydropterin synthase QueD [Desulfovibrionaceae bacterium]
MTQAKGYWQLTVRDKFSAAHALRHYQGKCENLHGHNFGVEICVRGDELSRPVEYVVDFGDLKRELKAVLSILDHQNLNELPEFLEMNPSSENLSRFIFRRLRPSMEKLKVSLVSVTVSESEKQSATYFEE